MNAKTERQKILGPRALNQQSANNTNWYFMLKCMAAFTFAATACAGAVVAATAKTAGTAAVGVAAAGATVATAPLASVLVLVGLISAACLLPFLFSNSSEVRVSSPSYYHPRLFMPIPFGPALHYHGHRHHGHPVHIGGHPGGHHHGHPVHMGGHPGGHHHGHGAAADMGHNHHHSHAPSFR